MEVIGLTYVFGSGSLQVPAAVSEWQKSHPARASQWADPHPGVVVEHLEQSSGRPESDDPLTNAALIGPGARCAASAKVAKARRAVNGKALVKRKPRHPTD